MQFAIEVWPSRISQLCRTSKFTRSTTKDMTNRSEKSPQYAVFLKDLRRDDTAQVGGKNASLGEMIAQLSERGVRVPGGFATTAQAYWRFLEENGLKKKIREALDGLDSQGVAKIGKKVRRFIFESSWPSDVGEAIRTAYGDISAGTDGETSVAVRSSATAEDLPEASFAGQQETYLNVRGVDDVLDACRKCYASLFTDRAISYREEKGFGHMDVALSVGVQRMIRADKGGAGVMFTIDTETGFRHVVCINAAWGLGETVVGGEVNPDEYIVHKPGLSDRSLTPILARSRGSKKVKAVYSRKREEQIRTVRTTRAEQCRHVLNDDEVVQLARWGLEIEQHYDCPMDIEWGRDGEGGDLYILQARPETVESQKDLSTLTTYSLQEEGEVLVGGIAIGRKAASGRIKRLKSPDEADTFNDGDILVTEMTDPDWGPLMKRASGIITDKGGRTAHAAIVSRELDIPAIVGCGDAVAALEKVNEVTMDCSRGEEGLVYEGILEIEVNKMKLDEIPQIKTGLMMNLASPDAALRWAQLPTDGIGLARIEFVINNEIKAHPLALLHPERVEGKEDRKAIRALLNGWEDGADYFIRKLSEGVAQLAAAQYPKPTLVRLSDFKTNEYADLLGGSGFEPEEANPMLGFRGAMRYLSERYDEAFALECAALKRARETIGLDNIRVMIPFCRTLDEVDGVLRRMADHGLVRGEKGLEIYLMAEVPVNVFLASEFAKRCDGFSIGSNDLTQLVLGISRDSEELSGYFDEMNPGVLKAIKTLIDQGHEAGIKVGICGQGPSDRPEFAEFLIRHGIDSISLNPDSVMSSIERFAAIEKG